MRIFILLLILDVIYILYLFIILQVVFPNAAVIKLLIDCGMNVNAKNEAKSTPLHVAVQPYNYSNEVSIFLKYGKKN